jgi:predicted oxidoreductase
VLVNTSLASANGFPLGTVQYCIAHGLQLQAWGSLAQGRYSGRSGGDDIEDATSQLVASLAASKNTTPETVVLWWLQQHPARIAPVIGSTNSDRIRACADAVDRPSALTHEEWYEMWTTARNAPLP